jgi:hypothetical protein
MPQVGPARQLAGSPPAGSPRGWPLTAGTRSAGVGAFQPLPDSPFADAQGVGALARRPALGLEVPGWEPSGCAPVRVWAVHAWECSISPRGFVFYARVFKQSILYDQASDKSLRQPNQSLG